MQLKATLTTLLLASTLMTSTAHATLINIFKNHLDWDVAINTTISIGLSGITSPAAEVFRSNISESGVEFINVTSYMNDFIYVQANQGLRINLPPQTTAVGFELRALDLAGGNYSMALSDGSVLTFPSSSDGSIEFFGLMFNSPISYIVISHDNSRVALDNFESETDLTLTTRIDVVPRSSTNKIDLRSRKDVSVVVLSDNDVQADDIDTTSLRFGATGVEAAVGSFVRQDMNGDGVKDLVANFPISKLGLVCTSTSAVLTGRIFTGQKIEGVDFVKPTNCR
jgi:hypothetical protein